MFGRVVMLGLIGCATACNASPASAQSDDWVWNEVVVYPEQCEDWDEWDKPADPFRIHGNTYYVGTCGISAILITGDDGHILIDGASRDGGPLVEANIAKAGFRIEDVKILLHSHEHFDHVGGLAYLQGRSGAQMIASSGAARALQSGKAQPDDPQFGTHDPFEPIDVTFTVGSFNRVSLGNVTLTPLETPGHTPGGLSWQWESCESEVCKTIVYADSLSPVSSDDYRFSDHPAYLGYYRESLARVAALDCDVLLTPHPSASNMPARLKGEAPWIDPSACHAYAASVTARLDGRLAKEAAAK